MPDRLAVVLRQQVAPVAVVDVGAGLQGRRRQGSGRKGVALYRLDVPGAVVGIDEGGVLGLAVVAGQLVLLVVGVFLPQGLGVVGGPDPLGGDVPGLVVGVIQVRHIQQTAGMGIVDAPHQGGGAVFVAGPVHIRVGRRGVILNRICYHFFATIYMMIAYIIQTIHMPKSVHNNIPPILRLRPDII